MAKKKKNEKLKLFIVSKMVMATSVHDALRKEKTIAPVSVYMDEDWKKNHL